MINLSSFIIHHAASRPDRTAFVYGDRNVGAYILDNAGAKLTFVDEESSPNSTPHIAQSSLVKTRNAGSGPKRGSGRRYVPTPSSAPISSG